MGISGECPCCKGTNLDYGAVELCDDQCYFPRVCQDCKTCGEEWYSMEFTGHYNMYDKDGNEIKEGDTVSKNNESDVKN